MAATMQFNDKFFDEIMKSAGVEALVKDAAERVLVTARRTAPVDTGAYRDGLAIDRKLAQYRVVYRVVGHDAKTVLVEAKTGNLARALKTAKRG